MYQKIVTFGATFPLNPIFLGWPFRLFARLRRIIFIALWSFFHHEIMSLAKHPKTLARIMDFGFWSFRGVPAEFPGSSRSMKIHLSVMKSHPEFIDFHAKSPPTGWNITQTSPHNCPNWSKIVTFGVTFPLNSTFWDNLFDAFPDFGASFSLLRDHFSITERAHAPCQKSWKPCANHGLLAFGVPGEFPKRSQRVPAEFPQSSHRVLRESLETRRSIKRSHQIHGKVIPNALIPIQK